MGKIGFGIIPVCACEWTNKNSSVLRYIPLRQKPYLELGILQIHRPLPVRQVVGYRC